MLFGKIVAKLFNMRELCRLIEKASLLMLFSCIPAVAQDYANVDQKVALYPKTFSHPKDLASYINKDFKDEDEKARAVFSWIAQNISYDVNSYFSGKHQQPIKFSYRNDAERKKKLDDIRMGKIVQALKSKKTLCHGYSLLFQEVCQLTGLQSEVVTGKTKTSEQQIGLSPKESTHAWNVVKTNGTWKLIDVTWGAGTVNESKRVFVRRFNSGYFFTDPNLFISNHFPDDEKWILANLDAKDYAASPLFLSEYYSNIVRFEGEKLGILSADKTGILNIRLKDVTEKDVLVFVLNQNKTAQKAAKKITGNFADFQVAVAENFSGFMTVFLNGKAISMHKIVPKGKSRV